ncbi:MAG: hypothetical protein M5U26_14210 [Planctomycetota bacterium]|nr:hypothetical protein [Planctomycetota bacterium]
MTESLKKGTARIQRVPLGAVTVPLSFGDQVITSLLFNHDANPVHHKPDHAVQWMLGLASNAALAGDSSELAQAGPEERTYTLGAKLLQHPEIVVMPGIILSSLCYERFIGPEELTVSVTTTFTYPLLVPTTGKVDVKIEAFELRGENPPDPDLGQVRHLLLEAHGPGLDGQPVRLLKLEALAYPAGTNPEAVYRKVVAPEFQSLEKLKDQQPSMPGISHPAAISEEDRRRYARIVGFDRRISPLAWQAKIPRVLTEIIEHMRGHEAYQKEVRGYYDGRPDEAERRAAIARYVEKEAKYRGIESGSREARAEELAGLAQQLYARQHTVFDPRQFVQGGPATKAQAPFKLDLHLYDFRLRRGIHRFYTGARQGENQVFMGEATVTGQPLVTKDLANFLAEINHSFETLKLFEYSPRG